MNDLQDRVHLILYEATIDGLIGVGAARKTYMLVLPPSVAEAAGSNPFPAGLEVSVAGLP